MIIGELATLVTARTEPFSRGMKSARKTAGDFARSIRTNVTGAVTGFVKSLGTAAVAAAGLGGALSAAGLLGYSLKLASNFEDAQVAFTTFLKSGDKADKMLAQLKKFSDATPFTAGEIREAGKQLLAFGFEADRITEYLQVMGDAAAAGQRPIADFVDIIGKVRAAGVASLGDVMRLADRSVQVFPILSKQLGVSTTEVRKFISAGKLGFEDLWEMMKSATSAGGLAENAMANLSKTTSGLFSTFKSKLDDMFTDVGTAILEGMELKTLTKQITSLAQMYKGTIVDATTGAVQLVMTALEKAPDWIADILDYIGRAELFWEKKVPKWTTLNPIESTKLLYGAVTKGDVDPFMSYMRSKTRPPDMERIREIERAAEIREIGRANREIVRNSPLTPERLTVADPVPRPPSGRLAVQPPGGGKAEKKLDDIDKTLRAIHEFQKASTGALPHGAIGIIEDF